MESNTVHRDTFRYAVVELLSLGVLVLSVGLLAGYEYVNTMFGETDGAALNVFPDLAWAVALLTATVSVGVAPFAARRLLAGDQ
jgi:ABC-type uncharacterized transport system permease subunit